MAPETDLPAEVHSNLLLSKPFRNNAVSIEELLFNDSQTIAAICKNVQTWKTGSPWFVRNQQSRKNRHQNTCDFIFPFLDRLMTSNEK